MRYCGVQPYDIINNKIYLLLGWEIDRHEFSEFGGGPESDDFFKEATREFHEETHGLFSSRSLHYHGPWSCSESGILYFVKIPYNQIEVDTWNIVNKYLLSNFTIQSDGVFEKEFLAWFELDNLPKNKISKYLLVNINKIKEIISIIETI